MYRCLRYFFPEPFDLLGFHSNLNNFQSIRGGELDALGLFQTADVMIFRRGGWVRPTTPDLSGVRSEST